MSYADAMIRAFDAGKAARAKGLSNSPCAHAAILEIVKDVSIPCYHVFQHFRAGWKA